MFTALNELNCSLQGRGISILVACEKLSVFKEKLLLWIRRIRKIENLVNFSSLEETFSKNALLQKLLNTCNYCVLHLMIIFRGESYKHVAIESITLLG